MNPRPPKKRRSDRDRMLDELEALQEKMEELARGLFMSRPHARDVVKSLPQFEASFSLGFTGRGEKRRAMMDGMLTRLERHIDDAIASHAAFRPGVVYSFFREVADPEEGCPKSPRDVFTGYSETGVPQFQSMLDHGIAKKDAGVEALAGEKGRVVTIKSGRDELVAARLPDFERKNRAYDIRGQVCFGYFTQKHEGREERFAVTVQIVRSSTRSRAVRLGLNLIGLLPDGRSAMRLVIEDPEHPLAMLLHNADRSLARINQELKKREAKDRLSHAAEAADSLLSEMALGQGRHTRRANWRTNHAKERAATGERPTGCARSDLGRAKPAHVLLDKAEKTFVIMGPKGRIHVFNDEGKHVTSLQMQKRSIDQRLAKNRWLPLGPDDGQAVLDLAKQAFKKAKRAAGTE